MNPFKVKKKKRNYPFKINNRECEKLKEVRRKVFRRDKYKCVRCGSRKKIVGHHLNGWNWFIQGRYDTANVCTVCTSCHNEFHNRYGRGNNTKGQFLEFLATKPHYSKIDMKFLSLKYKT